MNRDKRDKIMQRAAYIIFVLMYMGVCALMMHLSKKI